MSITASVWAGLITGLVLLVFVIPALARRIATDEDEPRMYRIVLWGGAIKLAAGPAYIFVIDHFYGGVADTVGYFGYGGRLADQMRHGDFTLNAGKFIGDGSTRISVAFAELFLGNSELATFFFFSFLAFVGTICFYRAFRLAVPEGDGVRYAKLLFFFPSVLFWTAAPGKDSITLLGLGLAAYGGALLFNRRLRGFFWLGAGGFLMGMIRPNVALIALLALALPYPLGKVRRSSMTPVVTWVGAAILVTGGVVLTGITMRHFGMHHLSRQSLQKVLNQNALNTGTAARNQIGDFNSSTQASTSLSISAVPKDFYYTIVRPLPIQAHGVTQIGSSLENVFLLWLLVSSRRRLWYGLRSMRRKPYVLASLLFVLVWIVLFASIGNLGILARERTQLIPWLLALTCLTGLPETNPFALAKGTPVSVPSDIALRLGSSSSEA